MYHGDNDLIDLINKQEEVRGPYYKFNTYSWGWEIT